MNDEKPFREKKTIDKCENNLFQTITIILLISYIFQVFPQISLLLYSKFHFGDQLLLWDQKCPKTSILIENEWNTDFFKSLFWIIELPFESDFVKFFCDIQAWFF